MRTRVLVVLATVAVALAVSACGTPSPTPSIASAAQTDSPGGSATPSMAPSPQPPTTTPAAETPFIHPEPTDWARPGSTAVTFVCRQVTDPATMSSETLVLTPWCDEMFRAGLAAAGSTSAEVARVQAILCAPASCQDNILLGYADGRVEGVRADWVGHLRLRDDGGYEPFPTTDPSPLEPSAWPWGAHSSFTPPAVGRPALPAGLPAVVTRLSGPMCGTLQSPDEQCFFRAVLSGKPALLADTSTGTDSTTISIFVFDGSGPLTQYSGAIGSGHETWPVSEWNRSSGALVLGPSGIYVRPVGDATTIR
jgi:hypothetical protein